MDYVTAKIALGCDVANVMCRGPDRPVSWPEVTVLQFLHGDDAVYDCEFVSSEVQSAQAEKRRMLGISIAILVVIVIGIATALATEVAA